MRISAMHLFTAFAAGAALSFVMTTASFADEVEHYFAEPSETIEEALRNFMEYNGKVQEVLSRETLSVADMEEIHEYTYTIELALAKMNEEFSALAVTLEELHLATEEHDEAIVRGIAETYFATAGALDE
jgi:metal-responsive CopG/Arc/MetJ family transcriptional regulator